MNKIWLCLGILALAAGSALGTPENNGVTTPSSDSSSETWFILPDNHPPQPQVTQSEQDSLIPFVERYRRSVLHRTTLNNPILKNPPPIETNPQP